MPSMQEQWRCDVTPVGWVLEKIFGACVAARTEDSRWCTEGTSDSPMMCSRSRTGGGPPSGTLALKKRLTENVEQGGDAMIAAYVPAEQRSSSLE
eukprot:234496-Pleurochrysis_carterae.AAC.1